HLGIAIGRQQYISGLQVTVNNTIAVCSIDCPRQLFRHLCAPPLRLWLAMKLTSQTLSFDKFQCNERQAGCLADLVNLNDIWMPETRRGLRLDAETCQQIGVGMHSGQYHLEGNHAVQTDLTGLI